MASQLPSLLILDAQVYDAVAESGTDDETRPPAS
jgi:hypothetical protein